MSQETYKILVVDDDARLRSLLERYLSEQGFNVRSVGGSERMDRLLERENFDLMVLDLMLRGEDGLTIGRRLRQQNNDIPIVMLTAKGDEIDRIIGLEMGADDYLAKPFNPRELLARVKSIVRRANALPPHQDVPDAAAYYFDVWKLDLVARNVVAPDGLVVPLSGAEFRLLRVLLEHPQRVLTRDQLLELVSGRESLPFDRSIDVLIGRLRKRLNDDGKEPVLIKTVRGAGY